MELGWRGTYTCEWWDDLGSAESGPVLDARSRLAWFGLDDGAPPLLAPKRESD